VVYSLTGVRFRNTGRVEMTISPEPTRRATIPPPELSLTKILEASRVEHELPAHTPARSAGEPLTAQQQQLLIEQLPNVRFIARRIHQGLPQQISIEDLYGAGLVGLLDALSKFDSTKHVQFRTYAQFRIRGAIIDSLRTLDWSSRGLRRKERSIAQAIQTLTVRLGRYPNDLEISQELDVDLASYRDLQFKLKGLEIGTLHSDPSENPSNEALVRLRSKPEDDPLFRYLQSESRERLTEAINGLPERERLVTTLLYYEELTMKEIGQILGVVESRISQIHTSAIVHLRALLGPPNLERNGERDYRKRLPKGRGRPRIIPPTSD
jgi:RNA polymerase sigma factor for flagellar operon FliA